MDCRTSDSATPGNATAGGFAILPPTTKGDAMDFTAVRKRDVEKDKGTGVQPVDLEAGDYWQDEAGDWHGYDALSGIRKLDGAPAAAAELPGQPSSDGESDKPAKPTTPRG